MSDETPANHYTELRNRYVELIHRHQELRATEGPKSPQTIELGDAIRELEDLLNEWNDRDDRDGEIRERGNRAP